MKIFTNFRTMNTEQKAKAYDEALERMKSWARGEHPECFTEAQKTAEFIFPELCESKDERIRKELIEFVKHRGGFKQEYIAWLEKQAEQKPIWNEEDEHRIKLLEALCEDKLFESVPNSTMYGEMRKTIDWLNFLRPQSKQEWNDEDEERIKNILSVLDVQVCWNGATGKKGNPYQNEIDWLNSLRPQPKQQWSEEDDNFFNDTIAFLKDTKNALDHVDWVKSLKQRICG